MAKDLKPKGFKTVMDIDAGGVFNTYHAAFDHLRKLESNAERFDLGVLPKPNAFGATLTKVLGAGEPPHSSPLAP